MWDGTVVETAIIRAHHAAAGGYDANLLEGGSNGGQKQRIEIAARSSTIRASWGRMRPPVPWMRRDGKKAFRSRPGGADGALIVVAHRLSTDRDADEIIATRAGRAIQRGTHDSLIRDEGGLYYQLMSTEAP